MEELWNYLGFAVIALAISVGYGLFKGGKEIMNNSIKNAGIYWLLITAISIIMFLITRLP